MHLASYAQEPTFEIKCTVVDEMGAVIPHAEVAFKCGQVPPDQIGHAIVHPVYISVVSSQTGIAGFGPRRDFETKLLS